MDGRDDIILNWLASRSSDRLPLFSIVVKRFANNRFSIFVNGGTIYTLAPSYADDWRLADLIIHHDNLWAQQHASRIRHEKTSFRVRS